MTKRDIMPIRLSKSEVILNVALLDTFKKDGDFDYIDCFLPILSHVLQMDNSVKIEVHKVRDLLWAEMKIQFPEASVSSVLKRAVKRNMLEKKFGNYLKVDGTLSEYAEKYRVNKKQIERDQVEIAAHFIKYAKEVFSRDITSEVFFDIFFNFLKENLLDILGPSYEPNIQGKSANNDNYLISCFFKNVWKKDVGFPPAIERNIKGFLLSNYLSTASHGLSEKIKNFRIYIDTPLLIAALGYNGKSKEIYSKELFSSLKEAGAELYILDVNEDELRGILKGWISDLKNKRYQSFKPHTLMLLRNKGYDEVTLERHLTLLDGTLQKIGIDKIEKPEFIEKIQIGDVELKKRLVKEGFVEDRISTDRDVECISCINRFRKGKKTYSYSDEIHFFLSKNLGLKKVANDYFYDEELACNDSIPPVMGEGIVASMLLAHHSGKFNELGRKLLLSQAYSVIFTDDSFLEKYSKRLDVLLKEVQITVDEYVLYRYDHEIRSFIKHYKVQNDIEDCDEDGFLDILEKIKEREKSKNKEEKQRAETELKFYKDSLKREEDRNKNFQLAHQEAKTKKNELIDENTGLKVSNQRLESFVNIVVFVLVLIIVITIGYFGTFLTKNMADGKMKLGIEIANILVNSTLFYFGVSGKGLRGIILDKIKGINEAS